MKKITIITLVLVMLVITAVPAFAAGGPPSDRGAASGYCTGDQARVGFRNQVTFGSGKQSGFGTRTPYALSGTITAINPQAMTVTLTVVCGNRLASPYIGSEVTLVTTDATRFLLRNEDGSVTPISFADLAVGQNISSHGKFVEGVFTAVRITSGALLVCASE